MGVRLTVVLRRGEGGLNMASSGSKGIPSSGFPGGLTFLQSTRKLDSFSPDVPELAYVAAASTSSKRSRTTGEVRCDLRTPSRLSKNLLLAH